MSGVRFVTLLIALSTSGCAASPQADSAPARPAHHTETGFKNLYIDDVRKNLFDILEMRYFGDVKWADHVAFADRIPHRNLDLKKVLTPGSQPQVSWLGHSTFLVQYRGINILTDPVFCERTSPFSFAGPKRYTAHVVDYASLPPIDYVIISHNHYDHLDADATQALSRDGNAPRYFVPLGLKAWLLEENPRIRPDHVTEMDWGDEVRHGGVRFGSHPSQHWSARSLYDRFETLWASWRVEVDDFSFWFAGDTGYNERLFRELGRQVPAVDISFIPIGAYSPRDFMKPYHLNPEEAVKVHQHMRTRQSIGMHWGTYPLTAEPPTEPPVRLRAAADKAALGADEFTVMQLGETRIVEDY